MPRFVGERGRSLHCPIRGEEEAIEDVQQPRHLCDGGLTADESRLPAPSDRWLTKIFDCEGDGVKEIPTSDLRGTLLRFFDGLELFLVF